MQELICCSRVATEILATLAVVGAEEAYIARKCVPTDGSITSTTSTRASAGIEDRSLDPCQLHRIDSCASSGFLSKPPKDSAAPLMTRCGLTPGAMAE
jgi:hypothetical protein